MRSELVKFDSPADPEENLRLAWIAFTSQLNKPKNLWHAYQGGKFLDQQTFSPEEDDAERDYRKDPAYIITRRKNSSHC